MNRIGRNSLALFGGIAVGGLLAVLLPSAAQAACKQWNVNGPWEIVQSNDTVAQFTFQQQGTALRGSGHVSNYYEGSCIGVGCDHYEKDDASVDGEIKGDSIQFTAYWNGGPQGTYEGKIDSHGRLKGTGYERQSPDSIVTWYSRGNAECTASADSALSTEEANPPPVKPQKRIKLESSAPSTPVQELCERARIARLRNSPAAPGLTQLCLERGGGETTQEISQ